MFLKTPQLFIIIKKYIYFYIFVVRFEFSITRKHIFSHYNAALIKAINSSQFIKHMINKHNI